jgi:ornithine cyclodeaminase/alanine dehydrogenase-like protein (mu-crystallin family)
MVTARSHQSAPPPHATSPSTSTAGACDAALGQMCDEVVAAGRRGELDTVAVLAAAIASRPDTSDDASPAPLPPKARTEEPARADLTSRMLARESGVRASFTRSFPDATADESLLYDLVAERAGLAVALREAQTRLAVRIPGLLTDARTARVAALVLRDLLGADATVAGRIEAALSAAANLRLQRRVARSGWSR